MTGLTAHRVTEQRRLAELGRRMGNCLATYGRNRLDGPDRIYEIRRDGATVYAVHVQAGRIAMFEAAHHRRPARADVPIVERLLRAAGAMDATSAEAAERRRRAEERRAERTRGRAPAPRRTRQPPRASAAPRPRPERLPYVSVQRLAAELLDPRTDRPEWPELAAALWVVGALPSLCDPADATWAPVITDLAGEVVTGALPLDGAHPVDPARRAEAVSRLERSADRRTREGFQRLAMIDLLRADVRP